MSGYSFKTSCEVAHKSRHLSFEFIEQLWHTVARSPTSSVLPISEVAPSPVSRVHRFCLANASAKCHRDRQALLRLHMMHCQRYSIAVQRFDFQTWSSSPGPRRHDLRKLALVEHVGDREGGRQFEGTRDQFTGSSRSIRTEVSDTRIARAASSERNRSLGMIEPIIFQVAVRQYPSNSAVLAS